MMKINRPLAVLAMLVLLGGVFAAFMGGTPAVSQYPPVIDGDILVGEYQYRCTVDASKRTPGATFKMDMYWTIDGEFIYVGLKAPTKGWVGWGLMPLVPTSANPKAGVADIVIGYVTEGNKLTIEDSYADGNFGHKPDTAFGGKNDIAKAAGREIVEGGTTFTIVEFQRKLYTQDRYDVAVPVRMEVYLAYSDADDLTTQHKGSGEGRAHRDINFVTGKVAVPRVDWACTGG
ncbi:MAG: DOMON domain-containing protein [Candidatus Bipolaricaulota bacterium]|nr:DOMON domain-containing protein [Candidatus Bipolaricaulota bacterium]MDW8030845.1 DOMON domain-containing protein [Candidatus Bipolaricaulota bacterium]